MFRVVGRNGDDDVTLRLITSSARSSPIVLYPPLPTDPFSIVNTNHAGHIQVENYAGCEACEGQSIDRSLALLFVTFAIRVIGRCPRIADIS
jgi:hypothetical protein